MGQTKDNKIFTSKFFETSTKEIIKNENEMDIDYEEDFSYASDYSNTVLSERLVINAVAIPGLTKWMIDTFNFEDENKLKKKILIYEYDNQSVKVNDERMSIGLAYNYTDCIVIHSWYNVNNYITNNLPKKINFSSDNLNNTRNNLKEYLFKIFNDNLIAEYVILSLTSQIINKLGTHLLGKLSINLISDEKRKQTEKNSNLTFKDVLKIILKNIVVNFVDLKISIKDLNNQLLVPRFDVDTEELKQAPLQMMKNSLLILDESEMIEGKLENLGVLNVGALKNLVEFQFLHYEFPYSKVEIPQECKIIILSNNKSLFKSNSLVEVKFNII